MEEIKKNLKVINIGVAVLAFILLFIPGFFTANIGIASGSASLLEGFEKGSVALFGIITILAIIGAGVSAHFKPNLTKIAIIVAFAGTLLSGICGTSGSFGIVKLGFIFFLALIIDAAWFAVNYLAEKK